MKPPKRTNLAGEAAKAIASNLLMLPLPLFVLGVRADNPNNPFAPDYFALGANFPD
jgi:hypothetical protein